MSKVVYNYKNYIALDTGRNIVVKNSKGKHENHAHFDRHTNKKGNLNLNTVKTFIRLIDSHRTDIKSRYLYIAAIRVVTDEDYLNDLKRLYKKKFEDRGCYYNSSKGVR